MFDIFTSIALHDALVLSHVFGLALGFGVALSIDFLVLRSLLAPRISPIVVDTVVQASRLTTIGLAVLWLTGLAFLLEYALLTPEKLGNPKIYAKITIVSLLTVNGWFIHKRIIPVLWRCSGGRLISRLSRRETLLFSVCAAVSTVSWVLPMVFGLNSALNFDYSVGHLLAQYALGCILLALSIGAALSWLQRRADETADGDLIGRSAARRRPPPAPARDTQERDLTVAKAA